MKRSIAILSVFALLAIGSFAAFSVTGCSTATQTKVHSVVTAAINTAGPKIGYYGYILIPEARPYLDEICALKDVVDSPDAPAKLKDALDNVWVLASKISDQQAAAIVMAINDVVSLAGLGTVTDYAIEDVKLAIVDIYNGVQLAKSGGKLALGYEVYDAGPLACIPSSGIPERGTAFTLLASAPVAATR